jgi:MFS family permease
MADKEPPQSTPQPAGPFVSFRYRDFRLFWLGLIISNIGTWMQITAISWLLYELTNSPLQLGLNGVFRAIPTICFGLFGGTIADRYDRKRLLLFTQVTLMLLAFILGLLDQMGRIQVWHIYALTLISSVVGSLDGPARQALFPSLVPRSVLPNAIALNSLLWKGTVLLGPALAGITISTVGTDGAFYANAASFLAVVLALYLMSASSSGGARAGRFLKDLKEGVSFVIAEKTILGVLVMEATSSIFGLDQAMLTIFARDILSVGASGLGFLQSARGLGALIGSGLLISIGQTRSQGRILLISAVLCGASFAFFGLSRSFPLSLLMLLIVGATDTIWGATRNTIIHFQTPEVIRGRVMGVLNLSNRGLHPLGQAETGLVVPLVGAREATFLGGMVVTAVTILIAWSIPGLPGLRLREAGEETLQAGQFEGQESGTEI